MKSDDFVTPGICVVVILVVLYLLIGFDAVIGAIIGIVATALVASYLSNDDDWFDSNGPRPA